MAATTLLSSEREVDLWQHRADYNWWSARQILFSPTSGGSGGIFSRLLFSRGFTATPSHWDLFVGQFFFLLQILVVAVVSCALSFVSLYFPL